ncbi:hypothetical protein T265_13361, partial [Opisthorchis viverrini]
GCGVGSCDLEAGADKLGCGVGSCDLEAGADKLVLFCGLKEEVRFIPNCSGLLHFLNFLFPPRPCPYIFYAENRRLFDYAQFCSGLINPDSQILFEYQLLKTYHPETRDQKNQTATKEAGFQQTCSQPQTGSPSGYTTGRDRDDFDELEGGPSVESSSGATDFGSGSSIETRRSVCSGTGAPNLSSAVTEELVDGEEWKVSTS